MVDGSGTTDFAQRVVEGTVPANKWIRLAAERHLRDLTEGPARGLHFDADAAAHACDFFQFLKHSKGKWGGDVFELSPWQRFIVGSIFGWQNAENLRRFRIAFVEVPRKNGKTTLAAGIALYLMACDGEPGAEVYGAATKREQARIVFDEAKAMVSMSPALSSVIEPFKYYLEIPATRSKFEPLASDYNSLDGLNPSAFVADEIHAWKSRDLWDVLTTGTGAREQPLALAITTAGDFCESIYNDLHNDCEQILERVYPDDSTGDDVFAFIASADVDDDWLDPGTWAKANPNLGVSLKVDDLAKVINAAKRNPREQNKVKRLRLNIRTSALEAWLQLDQWDKGASPWPFESLLPANGVKMACFGGLDLASTTDLAAFVLVFPWHNGTFRLVPKFWCPAESDNQASEKLREILDPWARAGHVEYTPGNTIDDKRIEESIRESHAMYDLKSLCYDPFNCESIAQRLSSHGVDMVRFSQNSSNYNEPSRYFERLVLESKLHHNGNPVLRWMASNMVIHTNGAGLIMPARKRSRNKIDGVVASIMALGAYLRTSADSPSVYESRDI